MNGSQVQVIQAEVAYRQSKIAHDYAVARGWELGLRRAGRRLASVWNHDSSSRPGVRRVAAH
ncbi:hypothetical protein [Luteipulveratus halotolerans]|uniref:Uncharacterized protein n=1 Tax=Luteipulveratus halotolerans TaxID=1631356 RepID=A0A0L6CLD2_9MICO|nr:hypothetical protein [Luteipulveratus halotolerans]KNX38524.1 hypothetical protein VV01_17420 [Luteipulveratus halotolerans]